MRFSAKVVASIAAFSVLVTASTSALADNFVGVGTVTGSVVNVREGAGTNYSVFAQAFAGGKLNVLENNSDWVKVQLDDGRQGFLSAQYISVSSPGNQTAYITGSIVNIRSGAGTEYDIVGTVAFGQSVTVTGQNNGWYSIVYNGSSGYVCGQYISFEQQQRLSTVGALLSQAKLQLGKAYSYGSMGPNSFDCSGFTSYVYKQLGYSINRTAAGQFSNGTYVDKGSLMPGDLVMFGNGNINHVGIYLGDNQFIHAENARTGVTITSLGASYYASHYVGARRIIS